MLFFHQAQNYRKQYPHQIVRRSENQEMTYPMIRRAQVSVLVHRMFLHIDTVLL